MVFRQLKIGGDRNFAYIIADPVTLQGAIVDPGSDPDTIMDEVRKLQIKITHIFNTHSHWDHIAANGEIAAETGARVFGFDSSVSDVTVSDGQVIHLGKLEMTIIHTPGHTPDSMCILVENKVLTGDTLFVGKIGGTGYGRDARQEYDSLHNRLLILPDTTEVFPGHDYGITPSSTIGREKRTNPFLLQPDFASFVDLKRNWTAYKKAHGIQ
ncbi:MAG TPA: hydroxyacylglutathione hydrolase family protein [bacterium]|nr:hydroxyacylglutathione hydrolase family protein [bacterium]